ncbi:MAG: hypothetical protein BWY82_02045 [Verrucomicrobia bacterium ADurb.Bin474]|nr:MAG: hypothetical protein BWY82_02045 [Verrucomicrobia bacterium ADurb.Bin474]
MILLIVRRDYQDSGFLGLFDKTTALIFFERLKSGRLLETVFQLPLEECSR